MEVNAHNTTAVGDGVIPLKQLNENLKGFNKETGILPISNEEINISSDKQDKYTLNRPRRFVDPLTLLEVASGIIELIELIVSESESAENFDEIFDHLNKNFEAINKNFKAIKNVEEKVDRNFLALKLVSKMVSETLSAVEKTRVEMQQGFSRVLDSIRDSRIEPVVSKLNSFIQYFSNEKEALEQLPENQIIAKLQAQNNMLLYLRDARTPKADSLHSLLYDIIHQGYAIPQDANDKVGFAALFALYYGTQTYVSVMFFLLDQCSFLADYHYQRYDTEKYNEYFDSILTTFQDFKRSLVGSGEGEYLIHHVISILRTVESKDFVKDIGENSFELITERLNSLTLIKLQLEEMKLPVIEDVPGKLRGKPKFKRQGINTPIGDWEDGAKVSYAIQYQENGTYSKIGEWSDPFTVSGKANPFLKIPVDPRRRTRIIFRKFNNACPQLVGVLENNYETSFRDVNRDLFIAASKFDENIAIHEVDALVRNGADVNAIFDKGRRAIHAAAQGDNTQLAREFLLNNNATNINVKDNNGYTPMHIAAEAGHDEFLELLIEHGADVNAKTYSEDLTALHIAAYKGDVPTVETLIKSDAIDINARERQGFSPLHSAVAGGFPVVRALVSHKNIDANAKSNEGLTPLHLSSMNTYIDIAQTLIESNKVDINARANGNLAALHFASMIGNLEVVRFLNSQNETDVNAESVYNWTPLHFAVSLKRKSVVWELLKVNDTNVSIRAEGNITPLHIATATGQDDVLLGLLEKGAAKDAQTKDGLTPLHLACRLGYQGIVSILLDNGANVNARDVSRSTALHIAAATGQGDIVLTLLEKDAAKELETKEGFTPLHLAFMHDHQDVVSILLDNGANVNAFTGNGSTLLHLAVQKGSLELVKYLVDEKGASLGSVNRDEKDSLQLTSELSIAKYLIEEKGCHYAHNVFDAVEKGHLGILKYLVSKGTDVNADINYYDTSDMKYIRAYTSQVPRKFSLLQIAVRFNNLDIIKYLVENGANINAKDDAGDTALHTAAGSHVTVHVMNYLIEKGSRINDKNKMGNTPLMTATDSGDLDLMSLLIDKGAHIDEENEAGATALYYAVFGRLHLVKYLVEKGANINDRAFGSTLFDSAFFSRSFDVALYLIEKGADVNIANDKGNTLLHYAAEYSTLDAIKCLLDKGANILAKDDNGRTVLHKAARCSCGNEDNIKYLVENTGANVYINARDKDGHTPLYVAIRSVNLNAVKCLVENGADVKNQSLLEVVHEMTTYAYSHRQSKVIEAFLKSVGADRRRRSIESRGQEIELSNYDYNTPTSDALTQKQKVDYNRVESNKATSVAIKPSALINTFARTTTEAIRNFSQFFTSYFKALPEMEHSEFPKNVAVEHADLTGTLVLVDLLVRKITGERYISAVAQPTSLPEAQACALTIREEFESIVKLSADQSQLSLHRLDIDFMAMQKEITGKIMSGKSREIPGILNSYVEKACPGREAGCRGKMSERKFSKFTAVFNKRLDAALNEPMAHALSGNSKFKTCNIKEQQTYEIFIQDHLPNAKGLREKQIFYLF